MSSLKSCVCYAFLIVGFASVDIAIADNTDLCVKFETTPATTVHAEINSLAVVQVRFVQTCLPKHHMVYALAVTPKNSTSSKPPLFCQMILRQDMSCSEQGGCSCNDVEKSITITKNMTSLQNEQWEIVGQITGMSEQVRATININVSDTRNQATPKTVTVAAVSRDGNVELSTVAEIKDNKGADNEDDLPFTETKGFFFIVAGSVFGLIVLIVIVVVAVVVCKLQGRTLLSAVRANKTSQDYDEAYEMRRFVVPTQAASTQTNMDSMPEFDPYYSEIRDQPSATGGYIPMDQGASQMPPTTVSDGYVPMERGVMPLATAATKNPPLPWPLPLPEVAEGSNPAVPYQNTAAMAKRSNDPYQNMQ